jgi:ribosomal protein S13
LSHRIRTPCLTACRTLGADIVESNSRWVVKGIAGKPATPENVVDVGNSGATLRLLSGISNSYSDEILHRARLSPCKQTRNLSDEEIEGLHGAINTVLEEWTIRPRKETRDGFPKKVTAFREEMAVPGNTASPARFARPRFSGFARAKTSVTTARSARPGENSSRAADRDRSFGTTRFRAMQKMTRPLAQKPIAKPCARPADMAM